MAPSPGPLLRRLASLLVRGPGAPFVLGDLEEAMQRDLQRGLSPGRARWRYLTNALASAASLWWDRRGLDRLSSLGFSSLDFKLGLRMAARYPVMSLVSILGMAVAIAIGAGAFGFIQAMMDPSLPLDEGHRVVSIQNNDARDPGNPQRQIVHDLVSWRDELGTVRDLAAFRTDRRNLIGGSAAPDLVRVAEMTASGFRVARVPPVRGRTLLEEDERAGAPPVVVIAEEEWRRRFDGDPDIVGRTVQLGATPHTVVGVMPEGFRFPVHHRYWVPLRVDPADHERGEGPSLEAFGRLAEGATMEEAQAELTAFGLRMAAAYPDSHEHRRPQILPYTHPFLDIDSPGMVMALRAAQVAISLLLVLIAVNVGVLVYARTAARASEIAVRSALGASRRRIVAQLFAEAFVMSATAAVLGLGMAAVALAQIEAFQGRTTDYELPFWIDLGLSPGMVAYVAGLAIVAGVIVGVLPGLTATGRRVQPRLQQAASRGSGMQLGRAWTSLIVAQVAVAVAVLPVALYVAGQSVVRGTTTPGYPVDDFLRGTLSIEREESPPAADAVAYEEAVHARFVEGAGELLRRLEAEAAVADVTFGRSFAGSGRYRRIEVEGAGAPGTALVNEVDPGFFEVFDVPMLIGESFVEADGREGSNVAVVDRVFAERLLGGGPVVGRRVRVVQRTSPEVVETGPWLEVMGVVPDFTVQLDYDPADPKLYLPVSLARAPEILTLAVRVRGGSAASFAGRVREIAAAVDPTLQLYELRTAAAVQREAQQALLGLALVIAAVTLSVLLLSAAGIYAMMSFTVARRRREIGIRSALGGEPRRILGAVFLRAGGQLGAGVLIGLLLAAALDWAAGGDLLPGGAAALLPGVAALMMAVGLAAALGPARRGLAVQPHEVLREE